jgi:hypothetical protein
MMFIEENLPRRLWQAQSYQYLTLLQPEHVDLAFLPHSLAQLSIVLVGRSKK